jgi:hypothetical protein
MSEKPPPAIDIEEAHRDRMREATRQFDCRHRDRDGLICLTCAGRALSAQQAEIARQAERIKELEASEQLAISMFRAEKARAASHAASETEGTERKHG